ncbi:GyrI-like domain-containing protein [Acidipropionibacterium jensenii]|uniref:GyrI-like domain-containing protein n=1 Tax=Acidipropionibacterium jensenii TaxID=1749 RepID=UPI001FD16878|nr:GyrI-like domain-containing protein [Acidipropionibacterium jensenii]
MAPPLGHRGSHRPRLRRVPGQTVLAVWRRVSIDDLDSWIDEATELMRTLAPVAAAQFVIYHDGLSTGHDGTVEVCQPIDPDSPGPADLPDGVVRRFESGRVEAYITLTKAELAYPEVDEFYQHLDDACTARGWRRTGPPRELYWADWDATAMDEPVCDVCFGIEEPGIDRADLP